MTYQGSLRIMHVCAPARSGGLETVVQMLATGLRQRGHDTVVAVVLSPREYEAHPLVEALLASDVTVHVLRVGNRDYRTERRLVRELMRVQQTEVLHTHGFRADVVNGTLARRAGAVHVTTLHGFTARNWRGKLYEWLQVRAARRAGAAVAVSAPIAQRVMAARPRGALSLIRNAVAPPSCPLSAEDARRLLGIPATDLLVGWIGRMSFEKGPDLMLEALRLVASRRSAASGVLRVAMIGDGPMREAMMRAASVLPSTVQVVFPGVIHQADRLLAAFDGLALTSRTEGTPMVILESMRAGIPIIATAVGGVPDVLDDRCALLAEPNAQSIAGQLNRFEAEAVARSARAVSARRRVEQHFGYDAWLTAYEDVYRQILR